MLLTFDLDYAGAESRRNVLDLCYALANLICATNSSFLRVSYGCHYCPPEGGFEDAQHLLHHEPPCIGVILGLALPQIEKNCCFYCWPTLNRYLKPWIAPSKIERTVFYCLSTSNRCCINYLDARYVSNRYFLNAFLNRIQTHFSKEKKACHFLFNTYIYKVF